jgi:hypothetical protein
MRVRESRLNCLISSRRNMNSSLARPHATLWRILPVAVLLPASFVAVDSFLLDALSGSWRTDWIMVLTMAAFIVQIGLMGVVCGRWIDHPALCWILYVWCWLLIDFQTLIAWVYANQTWWGDSFQAAALFAAQLGLVIIWAVLGTARWTVRFPVVLVLASLVMLPLIRFQYWGENAAVLFAMQLVSLGGICLVLRRQGFRLAIPHAEEGRPSSAPTTAHLQATQFGLRHVLIWMTALALICGLVRAVGLPFEQWTATRYGPSLPLFSSGVALAMVLVIALWAAMGTGSDRQRWLLVAVLIPLVGIANGLIEWLARIWHNRVWTAPWARGKPWWIWLRWEWFYSDERYLIAWICLSAGMLFATLLFVRALGYRLERVSSREDLRPEEATTAAAAN